MVKTNKSINCWLCGRTRKDIDLNFVASGIDEEKGDTEEMQDRIMCDNGSVNHSNKKVWVCPICKSVLYHHIARYIDSDDEMHPPKTKKVTLTVIDDD